MLFKFLILAGAACCAAAPLLAQAPAAPSSTLSADQLRAAVLEPGEGRKVAATLADELTGKFVIPEQGKQYAAMLRANAAAGRYDKGTRGELAKLITDDLMATHKDGHLHLSVTEPEPAGGNSGPPSDFPKLIQSAKWLAPGIAYIRPSAFFSTDEEIAAFKAFMRDHSSAKTMIFDLRNHHGGRLGEMDVIFPYLFAEKTPLVRMEMSRAIYDKFGSPFGEAPTLELTKDDARITATHYAVPGAATPLRDANVYVLTSNATASAGEHFALAFKSTGRATLIGEPTAGANHFGGPGPVGDHFTVWMPVGRTYDIKTGQDWEGAGVAPDLAVDPKQALVVALEKAGLSHADAVRIDATEVPLEPVHKDKVRAR